MRVNQTRERLLRGETVFGCGLQCYRSPEIARTFAAAGFDYVFIDMEHGTFDLETVQDTVKVSLENGITPIVRVAELLYSLVARLLDAGAQGIILPRVEDPKLLAEAISWMRFPPEGKRGYGVNPRSSSTRTATPSPFASSRPSPPWSAPTSCSR
jgi:2-keto-3-deoxy-L-rhamnonate aldolase RhmA